MKTGRLLLALLLGGAAIGCADEPLATEANGNLANTFVNNTPANNPMLARFHVTNPYWYWITDDPATGYLALLGTSNTEAECVVPTIFTSLDLQRVRHDPTDPTHDKVKELVLAREMYVTLYDGSYADWGATGFDCSYLSENKVATGWAHMVSVDNDLFAWNYDGPGHNSWGMVAQGQIEWVDGSGTARFNSVNRCVWDGDDLATVHCIQKIMVH